MKRVIFTLFTMLPLVAGGVALAGEADVLQVKASRSGDAWTFSVTVEHTDEGWEHYADRWDVLTPERKLLATRVLAHPHVGEQPFTRSLTGVEIPEGVSEVVVRARDSVHGYGGKEVRVGLSSASD